MTVFFSLEPEKNFNKIENNSYFFVEIIRFLSESFSEY